MPELQEILAIARSVGWGASYLLRSYYHGAINEGKLDIQNKKDGPVTAADIAVDRYILDRLKSNLGEQTFGYISEETYKLHSQQLPQDLVWIIDPLDGTRDFINRTGEYAIHIALVKDFRPLLAVVAYPEAEKLYYATLGNGTFVENRSGQITPLKVSENSQLSEITVVASRTHRNDRFNYLLQKLNFKTQQYVGSIGCKIATIVEQKADVYITLSSNSAPKDWDFAAPELILTEAGGQFTRFDGSFLKYNQGDVNQWGGIVASNSNCHKLICQESEKILLELERTENSSRRS